MSLYEDFQRGTGMFGITALSGERKLARALAPGLAGVMSQEVRANADVVGAQTGARAATDVASIRDLGDTFRTKLLNQANIDMTGMRESGANYRTKYGQDAETGRNMYTQDNTTDRQRKLLRFTGDESDKNRDQTNRFYDKFGQRTSAADLLGLETPREPVVASPGGVQRKKEDPYDPYGFESLLPGYTINSGS